MITDCNWLPTTRDIERGTPSTRTPAACHTAPLGEYQGTGLTLKKSFTLLPAKLAVITDSDPTIAVKVAKLLDQIVAGEDIRPQTTAQLAAFITPKAEASVRKRLAAIWPGGAITLVKRDAGPKGQPLSTFRVSKGSEATLIIYGLDADGKIGVLGVAPDREYE